MNASKKVKGNSKAEIVRYILDNQKAAKAELSQALNLSMPTVLQYTRELAGQGIVAEVGEYESTGGRKAKSLALQGDVAYTAGLDITANHISIVMVNLTGQVLKLVRKRKTFQNSPDYYNELSSEVEAFLDGEPFERKKILGIGISLPGIINKKERVLLKSHALRLENISLKVMEQLMPFPVYFENDANAAMIAEQNYLKEDAVYLSLSNTVGGAVSIGGSIFQGNEHKAGEFGHMVIVPDGRRCYCGKRGCVDAYCSPLALTNTLECTLEEVMRRVESKDPSVLGLWDEYLEYLAIVITNLRMAYDTNIILGGYMGEYMDKHMFELGKRVMKYNLFDSDVSYLKNCRYKKEGSAIGAAQYFFDRFIEQLK